jgi:ParB family chromosome partitioning protein
MTNALDRKCALRKNAPMTDTASAVTVQQVQARQIIAGTNDRKVFDRAALESLAASIAADGLAQPITVRPFTGLLELFQIVAGERRFRAITEVLGWTEVPCIVRELTDAEASRIMLTENLNRVDLSPVEEARAYRERLDAGMPLDDVALAAGKAKGIITWQVKILDAIPEALDLCDKGSLSTERVWHLARLDPNRQRAALRALTSQHLSLHAFRQVIDRLEAEAAAESMFDADDFLQIEEFVADAVAIQERRATRAQLVELLAALTADPADLAAQEAAAQALAAEGP